MTLIAETLTTLVAGDPVAHRNLAMVPLLGGRAGTPPYLTLREALDAGLAEVTEVSEGGSVPRLALVNRGQRPVLVVDGEELVGAKQNRILNITILAPGLATTVVPVSCVEQGRWSYRSARFGDEDRMLFHRARAAKAERVSESKHRNGGSDADQGQVWEHVAAKMCRMEAHSPSMAMADIYRHSSGSVEGFVEAIRPVPGQVGAIFAIDGRVEGLELFGWQESLPRYLPKLVRGYALDAIESRGRAKAAAPRSKVEAFLKLAAGASATAYPAAGLGEDLRLGGRGVAGGALAVDGAVLHLCAFRQAGSGPVESGDDGGTIRRRRGGQSGLFDDPPVVE